MNILLYYAAHNVKSLAKIYIKKNKIKYLLVEKHTLGQKKFQLWEMTGRETGFPTEYTFKKDATRDAKIISEFTGLKLIVN